MKAIITLAFLMFFIGLPNAQRTFRKAMFLHHSTGGRILGPNGSNTSVPVELTKYNATKSFTGSQMITLDEEWFKPEDNEWSTMRNFVEATSGYKISDYFKNHNVIIIKSCYPSSLIDIVGGSADTNNPTLKSIYNYKWHWRAMVRYMQKHPEIFFVIWTNAPLEPASTNTTQAANAKAFCDWAKNTLAKGLDPELGAFPKNVFVFDFFSKLTDTKGMMKVEYRSKSTDSHPNAAATALVAPQFVAEIFDAALAYERIVTSIDNPTVEQLKIYPVPANDHLTIEVENTSLPSTIALTNLVGQKLYSKTINSASDNAKITIDVSNYPAGFYLVNLESGGKPEVHKILIQ